MEVCVSNAQIVQIACPETIAPRSAKAVYEPRGSFVRTVQVGVAFHADVILFGRGNAEVPTCLMIQCMSANATATNAVIKAVPPSASAMKIAVCDRGSSARALTAWVAAIRTSAKSDCCMIALAESTSWAADSKCR